MVESPKCANSSASISAKPSNPECVTSLGPDNSKLSGACRRNPPSVPIALPPTQTSLARQVETECVIKIIWAKLNNTEDSVYRFTAVQLSCVSLVSRSFVDM